MGSVLLKHSYLFYSKQLSPLLHPYTFMSSKCNKLISSFLKDTKWAVFRGKMVHFTWYWKGSIVVCFRQDSSLDYKTNYLLLSYLTCLWMGINKSSVYQVELICYFLRLTNKWYLLIIFILRNLIFKCFLMNINRPN